MRRALAAPTGRSAGLGRAGIAPTSPRALFGPKKVENKSASGTNASTNATSGVQLVGGVIVAVAAASMLITTPLIQRLDALDRAQQLRFLELTTGLDELKTLLQSIPLR
ncbi:hypothetical protein TSOC_008281 [Tetrabaena socialis]|uniref:Uncharacterized protein n=1 Tax=Tetrabaena socialis TaxID=47790 RepID=A0A2J7ZYX8_9CHLO|nr:hypothetical protein TSOC_008281 [Tetrabaena socialis]|eukprot:PNH05456.1 hypothetical protein TSOC_008281 [Tetrabaena socialis]